MFGVNSEEWIREIKIFEELVKKITELSNKKSYTVISADHGLTNVPKENRFHILIMKTSTFTETKDLRILMVPKKKLLKSSQKFQDS